MQQQVVHLECPTPLTPTGWRSHAGKDHMIPLVYGVCVQLLLFCRYAGPTPSAAAAAVANVTAAAMQQYGLYPPMGPGPSPVALSQLERERLERLGESFILVT